MPTKKTPASEISVASLLAKAGKAYDHDIYANHIQMTITANELFVDFYYISPASGKSTPNTEHVQRAILPMNVAKGLATALANVVAKYEAENNITLPNSRDPDPDDKITIWP